ncbi:recombination protein RecT [Vreelandella aquamarina]|uniref:Recombinase RecT n=1 Tax=Vreelandella aquamarina TaxID=77097 RepID=A0A857GL36_9GAMM|nr:recombination protein RecT [Halomonas meridiana]QHD50018.1 recombinase RecT [Halomonas meridiana]
MTQQEGTLNQELQQASQNQTPAKKAMPTTIQGMLKDDRFKSQIARALPKHITPDRITRIALTEVNKTPQLGQCAPMSLFGAIVQSAQLGLELGGALGHAYLVPFKKNYKDDNGQWQNTMEAQFIIGYRGMIDLARRSGQMVSLQSHAVYEGDEFEFEYGLNEKLKHVPTRGEKGALIAVYAVAKLVGGGHQIEVMWREDVEAVKQASKAGKSGPWVDHFEEMAKKTVIRRLFKYLPVSVEMQRAVALDEQAESGAQDNNVFDGEFSYGEEAA